MANETDKKKENDSIKFETFRGLLSVTVEELQHHSRIVTSTSPQTLLRKSDYQFDVREFDVSAVLFLIDFIKGNEVDMKTLSHYAIADLLQLTSVLDMPVLRERLEKTLSVTVESSPDQVVNVLLSLCANEKFWRADIGRAAYDVTLRNYQELSKASAFHKIPAKILIEILDSCDLVAPSELEVFEVARKWLKFNHNRVLYAPNLLECVRFYRLNDQQRAYVIQSARKLPQGAQLEMIAKTAVGNLSGFRACMLKAHMQNSRCGAPPKEIRDRPLNVIPDFIDLAQLRKVPLMSTGIKRQLNSATDGKENSKLVTRDAHKQRSVRHRRRQARNQRNKDDLKIIENILGPKTTDIGTEESRLVERILGPGKLKRLQTATACSSPVAADAVPKIRVSDTTAKKTPTKKSDVCQSDDLTTATSPKPSEGSTSFMVASAIAATVASVASVDVPSPKPTSS